jgi:hypothetical protein
MSEDLGTVDPNRQCLRCFVMDDLDETAAD